jgi:hypothetical protein
MDDSENNKLATMRYFYLFIFVILIPQLTFSQKKYEFDVGLNDVTIYYSQKRDLALSGGVHYGKMYSELLISHGYYLYEPLLHSYAFDHHLKSSTGFGFSERFYPNGRSDAFSHFFFGQFMRENGKSINKESSGFNNQLPRDIETQCTGFFFGYGVCYTFRKTFTILHTIGIGRNYVFSVQHYEQDNHFYNILDTDSYGTFMMRFSLAYSIFTK